MLKKCGKITKQKKIAKKNKINEKIYLFYLFVSVRRIHNKIRMRKVRKKSCKVSYYFKPPGSLFATFTQRKIYYVQIVILVGSIDATDLYGYDSFSLRDE